MRRQQQQQLGQRRRLLISLLSPKSSMRKRPISSGSSSIFVVSSTSSSSSTNSSMSLARTISNTSTTTINRPSSLWKYQSLSSLSSMFHTTTRNLLAEDDNDDNNNMKKEQEKKMTADGVNDNENDASSSDFSANNNNNNKKKKKKKRSKVNAESVEYNNRRSIYKKQLHLIRKQYSNEISILNQRDQEERNIIERNIRRKALENKRLRDIRSANNAIRNEHIRQQRHKEWNQYLNEVQERRDERHQISTLARQEVINELEKESVHWLTTPDEVNNAFTPNAIQMLWSRRGGVLGAPNPTYDCQYWSMELLTPTTKLPGSFKSMQQTLLEDIEEEIYNKANIDDEFWNSTPIENESDSDSDSAAAADGISTRNTRLEKQLILENRAKLRALLIRAGRIELIKRQYEMLYEDSQVDDPTVEPPNAQPIPTRSLLNNPKALQLEGAKLLLKDPTKFFYFENYKTNNSQQQQDEDEDADVSSEVGSTEYVGPTLGAPIGIRDSLQRGGSNDPGSADDFDYDYARTVGIPPSPDTRTEREKKQQEREEKMMAAAEAAAEEGEDSRPTSSSSSAMNVDMAAADQDIDDLQPDIIYEDIEQAAYNDDGDEWKIGLDPEKDKEILNSHRYERYNEKEIDYVVQKLQKHIEFYEQYLSIDIQELKHHVITDRENKNKQKQKQQQLEPEEDADKEEATTTTTTSAAAAEQEQLEAELEAAVIALSDSELLALSDLDDRYYTSVLHQQQEDGDSIDDDDQKKKKLSDQEIEDIRALKIPNLTSKQLYILLQRDRTATAV